jgi:hypothetical protein
MRRTLLSTWIILTGGAATLLICGCLPPGDSILEELSDRRYPIDPTAATLSVTNRDGSIRIYGAGGDSREVRVETVTKAYTPERLKAISIQVTAQRDSISIDTIYSGEAGGALADRSGTVDYVIVVPQKIRIAKLELSNGEVLLEEIRSKEAYAQLGMGRFFVRNCFGNIDIGVKTGNLTLFYDWWEQQGFTIRSVVEDGNAFAYLPTEAEFHLSAHAATGKISNDFEEMEQRRAEPTDKIDMLVGGAQNPKIEIEAQDGNIRIAEHNP